MIREAGNFFPYDGLVSEYPGHILGRDFGIVPAMKAHDGRLTATLLQAIYESLGELPPILALI